MNLSEHARLMDRIGELEAELAQKTKLLTESGLIEILVENERYATLQQRIFDWGRETFGAGQRAGGVYAHLVREIKELADDLYDGEELADCTILLFELAGFAGVDLLDEVEKKHKINEGRKWGGIEENGSILHIEESDEKDQG